MNPLIAPESRPRSMRRHHHLMGKAVALCLVVMLALSSVACDCSNSSQNSAGHKPNVAVNWVVASLVGWGAGAATLFLTKNTIAARVVGGAADLATSYLLEQFDVQCKACGTTTPYRDLYAGEGKPLSVACSNSDCFLHQSDAASLIVFSTMERMNALLAKIEQKLPPSCLLTKRSESDGSVTLTWYTHNSTATSINGSSVPSSGSTVVHPTQTCQYVLKALSRYGRAEDSVSVEGPPQVIRVEPQPDVKQRTELERLETAYVVVPAGEIIEGVLEDDLQTGRASVGDIFHVRVTRLVVVNGSVAVPTGSEITGSVIEAVGSGRVQGRARLGLQFDQIEIGSRTYPLYAQRFTREAEPTKRKDAGKVAVGAAIGAAIGAALGGKKGAARGAGAGGAAGAGAVLATKGDEVHLGEGERLSVRLAGPLRIDQGRR